MSVLTVEAATAAIAAARHQTAATGPEPVVVVTMSALPYWPPGPADYRLVGLMGGAGSIGLGLALGQPDRPVWVIDGDGSLLMQLGVLTAIGAAAPVNLVHFVMANRVYAISGEQPTPGPASWTGLFRDAGYAAAARCATAAEITGTLPGPASGPLGIEIVCAAVRPDFPPGGFDVDPSAEARRVRAALADR